MTRLVRSAKQIDRPTAACLKLRFTRFVLGSCINVLEGLSHRDISKHFLTTRGLFLRYGFEDSIIFGVIGT